jgi:hypothetical protein
MQNFCRINLFVFVLILILTASTNVLAQDVAIGTGTTSNTEWVYPTPFPDKDGSTRTQFLYLASELTAAGMTPGTIDAIRFTVTDLGIYFDPATSVIDRLSIKIGGTSTTSLDANAWETVPNIVRDAADYLPVPGVNSFTFSTPFFWNGVDNIVLEICTDGTISGSRNGQVQVQWTTGLPFNGSHTIGELFTGGMCDATNYNNQGDQTSRPNIIFHFTPAPPCTSAGLTAGNAVAKVNRVCSGEPIELSLSGSTIATGLSYQWQSSTDHVNWSNITNGTTAAITTKQNSTTWYRAIVTCASGGSATSAEVQVITPSPLSGTFTINQTLPAGGGNFKTFNDAYNYIKCGIDGPVVFNVAPNSGIYHEQLIVSPVPGASATNTITFNGAAGAAIEFAAENTNNRATIKLDGADFVVFNNLEVHATGATYGYGFHLTNDADNNVINGCDIRTDSTKYTTNFAGIVVSAGNSATALGAALCDWNTFSNNRITGGNYGITLVGNANEANGNNQIINNTIREFSGQAIYVACSFTTLIEGNLIKRDQRSENYNTSYGIYATNINAKMTVSKNTITHMYSGGAGEATFYGIYFNSAAALGGLENIVSNNLIYNINGGGSVYGIYNQFSHNTFYYHNTVSLDGNGVSLSADKFTVGFYLDGATGVRIHNNNISVTRSGPTTNVVMYFMSLPSDIQSDNNNLYFTSGTGARHTGFVNGAPSDLLSDWQAASGVDAHSITADPLFANLPEGDCTPGNPALDKAGMDAGITTDIKGVTRSTPPDIGAFEFNPPPCTVPPTPGTVVLSVGNICVDKSFTISLTGHSVGATQTYQLEGSTSQTGPFTPIGNPSLNPVFSLAATADMWYRITTTCSGQLASTPPVQLVVNQLFPAGTYTINKNAPASATNFQSFAAALSALNCGIAGPIVFNVEANSGPYEEQLIIPAIKGASATNTITFNGNGNTLHFSSDDYEEKAVIKLRDADHFIFDNLVIDATGTGSYGFGIHLLENADSNIVRNCTILCPTTGSSDGYAGIVMSATNGEMYATGDTWCDYNLFENNTIKGGYWGISLVGDPVYNQFFDNFINENRVINNTIEDFYERGIYIIGTDKAVVQGNTISRPTRANAGNFYGIYSDGTNADLLINGNRIFNPFGANPNSTQSFYGMYFEGAGHERPASITNNAIYYINGRGTQYGIYLTFLYGLKVNHNTIALDDRSVPVSVTSTTCGITVNSLGEVEIKNNMVTITRSGSGYKYGFNVASGDVVNLDLNNNNYFINGAGGNNHTGYRNGPRTTLADWQSATNRDLNSYSIDPLYFDVAAGNLSPTIAPVDNLGTPVDVASDIMNQVRHNTTPDIGAWEFSPVSCISGIAAGTASATPNSDICMGTVVTLNLTGNTVSGYQTYRWERSADGATGWESISDTLYVSEFKTEVYTNSWYRCIVSCSGINDTSTLAQVQLNPPMAGGVYSIQPDGSGDFTSFTAAVAALQCGIDGAVTFEVAPGTYNEQVYMRRIPGASETNRVTFRSANGDPASVTLTYAGTVNANFVLKLDSAHYITFRDMSITATVAANARVVELAGNSSYDSLVNNIITTLATSNTSTARAAIFGSSLNGNGIVIMGNTINNGSSGIYLAATSINRGRNLVITGNTLKGFYQYGIYTTFNNHVRITNNTVTVAAPANSTAYGIYTADADSSFVTSGNQVQVSNTTTTIHGMYFVRTTGLNATPGVIENNKVIAVTNNSGSLYGININNASYSRIINNVISIQTSGNQSYGLRSNSNIRARVFNNTVVSRASSANDNVVAWVGDGGFNDLYYADLRNNIFSHEGGGVALYVNDLNWRQLDQLYSDYNLLYTTGGTLVQHGGTAYATLAEWQKGGDLDVNSIVYKPALVSAANPAPDVNAPDVWAIHGRGIQITDNDRDHNNQPRPTSLKAGVPDLGAYEFEPASVPTAAVASPATPAANTYQVFMLGTDTVAIIHWGATAPAGITMRRYSGAQPNGLEPGTDYMYFYNDVVVSGGGTYEYSIDQRYLDPWRGFIDNEERIRLGKTDNAGAWSVDAASQVNTVGNSITQSDLDFMDQFTGLTNPAIPYPPVDSSRNDTLNLGLRFWVGYGHNEYIDNFTVRMGGGEKDANVTVKVHGTNWVRHYFVPAHTFVISDPIPRRGASGAELLTEGLSDRGISIESTEPIAVFTYSEGELSSTGSTMLLPVSAYGYEYYALTYSQYNIEISNTFNVHSWFYIIADHDSTLVEITPSNPTLGGRAKGVPFTVLMNKGEVYNVLGAIKTQNENFDLTGSRVRVLSNASGNCYPVAVFSGNSDAYIDCSESFVPFGGFLIQQNFPVQTWGRRYLTAPTQRSLEPTVPQTNFYRVLVQDPATVVKVNGATLTGLINNSYYQYMSATADYIEADKPVSVAQFIPGASNECDFGLNTDPEIFYLPPMGWGIKKADLYRTELRIRNDNYLTVIIPTAGLNSLLIDGSNKFDSTYTHPNLPGYSVVVKRWEPSETTSTIQSDSMFTAIGYGFGGGNSYGYIVGKAINSNQPIPGITNNYDSSGHFSAFTCVGTPFRYSVLIPMVPTSITWRFSQAANMVPDADSVQVDPVATDTVEINGRTYYRFDLQQDYVFPATGEYTIPVEYIHPVIENCIHTEKRMFTVKVVATPVVDINYVSAGCVSDTIDFSATVQAENGDEVHALHWNFGNNTTSDELMPRKLYTAAGSYDVKVDAITKVGCIASGTETLELKGPAAFEFVSDTAGACPGNAVTLSIKDPETNVTYNWYETETGGSIVHTGASHTVNQLNDEVTLYVSAEKDGCTSKPRKPVTAIQFPAITAPVVRVDTVGVNVVRFAWDAVPDADSYEVSVDNSVSWTTPSSGANGLTHTVSGLMPGQRVTIRVKAIHPNGCEDAISVEVSATTIPDQVFIPNAFSPNNDGLNDEFKIEGYVIRSMQLRVFNQWGELVFETSNQNQGWDGKHKGKLQPSGVYMYVCSMVLQDGSKLVRKGAVNLVR